MSSQIPGPAYRIITNRLVIRCWNPEDAPLQDAAVNESLEHLRPWMPWAVDEPSELQVRIDRLRRFRGNFDLGRDFLYGIFNPGETQVLGSTGLHTGLEGSAREIGYWIHKDYINLGYATEVSAALVKVAFEIEGVDRVEIQCGPTNVRSMTIPKKLGFQHEATLRRRTVTPEGKPRDTMIWSLFADEYPASPAAGEEIQAYDAAGRRIL